MRQKHRKLTESLNDSSVAKCVCYVVCSSYIIYSTTLLLTTHRWWEAMVVQYRSKHYKFLNRKDDLIGVTAYRTLPIYDIIEDYCNLQEKYDEMYGYGTLVGLVEADMAKRFDSAIMKFAVTIRRTDEHNYKEKQKELEMSY